MSSIDYPVAEQFLGCYFHPDWFEEFDTPEEAVEAYCSSHRAHSIRAASDELEKMVTTIHSDDELLSLLLELGCFYYPGADGKSASEWIGEVRAQLARY